MRIAIVQFPGSNCERETMLAVKRAGMEPVEFLWNEPREKLQTMDGFIIIGGFSYEDRSRAGIIAALDPVMQELKLQSEQGKPILGICNGAQILVETGMVPGIENNKPCMVLTENKRISHGKILGTGYYNTWVNLKLSDEYQRNAFTRHLNNKSILHVPIAHGEGRFEMSPALLQEIKVQGLNVFQYCDAQGKIEDHFPINPNGSIDNIAAISNKAGNVMAIMPHPERTPNGDAIFHSMRDYIADSKQHQKNTVHSRRDHIAETKQQPVTPLHYYPRPKAASRYQKAKNAHECIVELIITDNQALTVQNTLRKLGMPVTVQRKVHWEIHCENEKAFQEIKKSGVLYNDRKEMEVKSFNANTMSYLVRAKEDLLGQQKLQTLEDHFNVNGVKAISHGVLWQFSCEDAKITDFIDHILSTNIIYNPYAHDYYHYEPVVS